MPDRIPDAAIVGETNDRDKSASDAYHDRCMAVVGFSSLWADVSKLGSEYGPDWGIARYVLGPERLVQVARRYGWRPGDADVLRDRLRDLIDECDAERLRMAREATVIRDESRKPVPQFIRERYGGKGDTDG